MGKALMKQFELNGVIFQIEDTEANIKVNQDGFYSMSCDIETARTIYKEVRKGPSANDDPILVNNIIKAMVRNSKKSKKTYEQITVRAEVKKLLAGGGITYTADVVLEDCEKVRERDMTVMGQTGWSAEQAIKNLNERYKFINITVVPVANVKTYLNGEIF